MASRTNITRSLRADVLLDAQSLRESVDIQQGVASLSLGAASALAARASVFGGACVPPIFLEKNTQCAVSFSPNGCLPVSEALPERATCAV
jgi:hypothetical protein